MSTDNLEDLRRQFNEAREAGSWDLAAELSQQIIDFEELRNARDAARDAGDLQRAAELSQRITNMEIGQVTEIRPWDIVQVRSKGDPEKWLDFIAIRDDSDIHYAKQILAGTHSEFRDSGNFRVLIKPREENRWQTQYVYGG